MDTRNYLYMIHGSTIATRTMKKISFLICAILIGVMGCKVPYTPKVTAANSNILVVEGVIAIGNDATNIKLSRTVNLTSTVTVNPEFNAQVTIESNAGGSYQLYDAGGGNYSSGYLGLDNTLQYRLRIRTQDGVEYLSDFETAKATPPIDSVGFTIQPNGLQIYVNTHDPANATRYYRWDYAETWKFHAKYDSQFVTDGAELVFRTNQVYTCFANNYSSTIVLGSTANLSKDVIYQQPLTQVVSTSEKLESRYSILVKQYALTKDEYNFWTNLKKNTEQLGGIFDPQPSNINGNIHCTTDPKRPVIGWVPVTDVQYTRIFIDNSSLPNSWFPTYPYDCSVDSNLFCRPEGTSCLNEVEENLIPLNAGNVPLSSIVATGSPAVIGYTSSSIECSDCTIRGSNVQPSFWR
jgi:hypothetical protein